MVDICTHVAPFPATLYTWLVYCLIPPFVGVSIVGGLGGGIIKSPVLELLLDFTQSESTFIAYGLMFGGCFGNLFLIITKRHPIEVLSVNELIIYVNRTNP